MKLAAILAIGISITMASLAYWNSTSTGHQMQLEREQLVTQVSSLEKKLHDVSQFQQLLHEFNGQNSSSQTTDSEAVRNQTQIDDRVKNQRHANDNQWQEIDNLKSQQVSQKRLLDQINFDLDKLQRDQNAIDRKFQKVSKVVSSSKAAHLADLTRRVDDLYRRLQR